MAFLKGIRSENLLLTVLLFAVLIYKLHVHIPADKIFLLLGAVLLIMAGGNLENDLYDRTTDAHNRKFNYYHVKHRLRLRFLPFLFYLAGWILGTMLSFRAGKPGLSLYFLGVIILLSNYNRVLKKTPLFGNVLVAILVMLLVINFIIFFPLPRKEMITLLFLSSFAFISTLNREIVKDLLDRKGDKLSGYVTLGVISPRQALRLVFAFHIILLLLLFSVIFFTGQLGYKIILVLLLTAFVMYALKWITGKIRLKKLEKFYKILMLAGILIYGIL